MLNVILMRVILLSVIMLIVIMLNVILLCIILCYFGECYAEYRNAHMLFSKSVLEYIQSHIDLSRDYQDKKANLKSKLGLVL